MSLYFRFAFLMIAAATFSGTPAHAEKTPSDYLAYGWNYTYYHPYVSELARIARVQPQSADEQATCDSFYSKVKANHEMKIVLGVGYYDFSEGEPFSFNYRPDGSLGEETVNFGMNATLDQTFIKVYHELLTSKCTGSLQFCGFEEDSPGVYSKIVKAPDGERIKATLELRSPSVSPSHEQNVGPLKAQQDASSASVTNWFFKSIQGADFVVYNGHARKGGGPDFTPPRLLDNKHPAYGWYQRNTPGLTKLLAALSGPEKPAGLMLMACNSVNLFEAKVEKVAPKIAFSGMNVVPATGLIPVKGTIAGIDSFLKFQCQSGMNQEFTVDDDMRTQLKTMSIKSR